MWLEMVLSFTHRDTKLDVAESFRFTGDLCVCLKAHSDPKNPTPSTADLVFKAETGFFSGCGPSPLHVRMQEYHQVPSTSVLFHPSIPFEVDDLTHLGT